MASHDTSNKSAAEEHDPPLPPPAPSYDPTKFQRPHPDDRGGGGGGSKTAARKPTAKPEQASSASPKTSDTTKDKPAAEESEEGKGKDAPLPDLCAWCEKPGAKRRCSQCKSVVYCGEACQRVRGPGSRIRPCS